MRCNVDEVMICCNVLESAEEGERTSDESREVTVAYDVEVK